MTPLRTLRVPGASQPEGRDWSNANRMFDHPTGCRCSTCTLAARLGFHVRNYSPEATRRAVREVVRKSRITY